MHNFVSFNLQVLSAEKSLIRAVSSAAFYGKGVFTTAAIYDSKPFLWEKHWRRLEKNAEKLNIDIAEFSEEAVKHALSQLIETNNLETARARLTLFDQRLSNPWSFETATKTGLLMTTADFRETKSEFSLTVSPFPVNSRSPLKNIKSCNYLEHLLAFEEARRRGFDEAVRLNEREEIVSASMANLFWVKNETIFTPGLETGSLAGTTREFLTENFAVREVQAKLSELAGADEIFLTSAGLGIRPAVFENVRKSDVSIVSKLKEYLDLQKVKA